MEKKAKEEEQQKLKRRWHEDKMREDAKRLKEQEQEKQKEDKARRIDELKRQLEELEKAANQEDEEMQGDDEEYEEEWDGFILALGTFICLAGFTWYVLVCWFIALDAPFLNNYLGNLVDPEYAAFLKSFVYDQGEEKLRQMFCPEIYYGLELRRPRARTKAKRILLPYKFYQIN